MQGFGIRIGLLASVAAACLAAPGVVAFQEVRDVEFPPDFDLRQPADPERLQQNRADVARRFQERFGPAVRLHWGDRSDRPLYAYQPGEVLAVVPSGRRVAAVRAFLRAGRDVFGLSDREIDALDAAKVYETPAIGLTHVQFLQRVAGISVFRGQVRVNLDARGGVINVAGEYFPGLPEPSPPSTDAAQALRVAALGLGLSGAVPAVLEREATPERLTRFAAGGEYLEPPEARLVLLPEGDGGARLTWEVSVWEGVSGWDNLYRVLVDAVTGEPVLRELMTLYMADPADAVGTVFEEMDPDSGPYVQVPFEGDPVASPDNWVAAAQTETTGNNVISRRDWGGRNMDNEPLADGGTNLEFNFPFTDQYASTGQIGDTDAAIANAFHMGNLIHDHWHALGFDEPAGNYQLDNFGLGGAGDDHVRVDVQDSWVIMGVRNNANWSPTNDGTKPRTNYFMWTSPNRDGAFDNGVIWHEFGHGLSTRLVGGPSTQCLNGAQGGGMGEGWGDWLAINYFGEAGDDPAGPAAVGAYVTGDPDGIRRYPYHHDMAIDPLTYADLCNQGCQVHREGEIWASTLWDMRHDLILSLGFAEGKLRSEQLVIDAMKLSACSPNFVTMRDSILQANQQRYAGDQECVIRAAFARRGLGAEASSNGSGGDATADFTVTGPLGDSLGYDDVTTLSWAAIAGGVQYGVARGTFGPLASANTFDDATCQGNVSGTTYADPAVPASANGFYYLVAPEDACGRGHYGADSAGAVRSVTDCP